MVSFRTKTILGVALIEAIALIVLIWSSLDYLTNSNADELRKRAYTTAVVFASTTKDAVLSNDLSSLESFVAGVMGNPGIVYARVIGRGKILAAGGDPTALSRPFVADSNLSDVVDGVFDAYANVFVGTINYGRVELGVSTTAFGELVDNARNRALSIAATEMLVVALFSFALGTYLTKGLRSLRDGTRKLAQGELGHQIPLRGNDELAETAAAFNEMSQQLHRASDERNNATLALQELNDSLEQRVQSRTKELGLANEELAFRALHDGLTKLPNRILFHDRVVQAILTDQRSKSKSAILMMDLDRFKIANDTLGHHWGDLILQEVAKRLRSCLRAADSVARIGGDEYGMVLAQLSDSVEVTAIAQRLVTVIGQPIVIGAQRADVGISIGIAFHPDHGDSADVLLRNADIAMYDAKTRKLGYRIFDVSLGEKEIEKTHLQSELPRAIENNELILHFQPKIDFATRKVSGAEALVRWNHPRHGLLYPDKFIPIAEQSGTIKALTVWVLEHALRQCKIWHDNGKKIGIAVNVSAVNLEDPEFPRSAIDIIKRHAIAPDMIEMEITETAVMSNPLRAIEAISTLAQFGIALSIDDFGTGYSSMAYLKKLVLAKIKIDKSFVMDMATNPQDDVIVRSTIDLGHNLGLKVIAEGVESEEAWQRLKELGCDSAQGYLISKPVSSEKFLQWMQESQWG